MPQFLVRSVFLVCVACQMRLVFLMCPACPVCLGYLVCPVGPACLACQCVCCLWRARCAPYP